MAEYVRATILFGILQEARLFEQRNARRRGLFGQDLLVSLLSLEAGCSMIQTNLRSVQEDFHRYSGYSVRWNRSFTSQPWPLQRPNDVNLTLALQGSTTRVPHIQIKIKATGFGYCPDGARLLTNCHCWLKPQNVPGNLNQCEKEQETDSRSTLLL